MDTSASVFVLGTVVDNSGAPVPGAAVGPTGLAGFECSWDTYSAYALDSAMTDSAGMFEQLVYVFDGPGSHCVEFFVRDDLMGWADTIFASAMRFLHHAELPDTVPLRLEVRPGG